MIQLPVSNEVVAHGASEEVVMQTCYYHEHYEIILNRLAAFTVLRYESSVESATGAQMRSRMTLVKTIFLFSLP